jgi:hypothetical protein
VVAAFLEAVAPAELDALVAAERARRDAEEGLRKAEKEQLQRLRYEAALAERQYRRVDPDNRLVAAELERRWEVALRELRRAEESEAVGDEHENGPAPAELTEELKAAFTDIGRRLPEVWDEDLLSRRQRKALLRCLIEKVILRRTAPDTIQTRIVWKGGLSTTLEVSTTVGAFFDLSGAEEMERLVVELFEEGNTDRQIARRLTELGHRSPQRKHVLRSTVQTIRHRHGLIRGARAKGASREHHVPGSLTLPEVARRLEVPNPWMYNRIYNGAFQVVKDERTRLYLFPADPTPIERFRELKEGKVRKLQS